MISIGLTGLGMRQIMCYIMMMTNHLQFNFNFNLPLLFTLTPSQYADTTLIIPER